MKISLHRMFTSKSCARWPRILAASVSCSTCGATLAEPFGMARQRSICAPIWFKTFHLRYYSYLFLEEPISCSLIALDFSALYVQKAPRLYQSEARPLYPDAPCYFGKRILSKQRYAYYYFFLLGEYFLYLHNVGLKFFDSSLNAIVDADLATVSSTFDSRGSAPAYGFKQMQALGACIGCREGILSEKRVCYCVPSTLPPLTGSGSRPTDRTKAEVPLVTHPSFPYRFLNLF